VLEIRSGVRQCRHLLTAQDRREFASNFRPRELFLLDRVQLIGADMFRPELVRGLVESPGEVRHGFCIPNGSYAWNTLAAEDHRSFADAVSS
jgi:hypothetical protein